MNPNTASIATPAAADPAPIPALVPVLRFVLLLVGIGFVAVAEAASAVDKIYVDAEEKDA